MRAMLLCAGLGTRLGPLSDARPKPMLPVCDRPILEFGIANLVAQGVTDLVINLHHRGDVIERELGDGRRFGARIQYVVETTILGTGGGLKNALTLLTEGGNDDAPFVSLNGKLIFDVDLAAVLDTFLRARDALGCMVVQRVPDAVAWGAVAVTRDDGDLRVTNILGEGTHMFCGVHITRPSTVRRLPEGEACMVRQGYLPWLQAGARVVAHEHERGYFAEHSTPERYLASNTALLNDPSLRHPPGALRGIDPTARIHPTAELRMPVRIGPGAHIGAGAIIGPSVVVGAGATIAPRSHLEQCVVWPGVSASGTHQDAIVTSKGHIQTQRIVRA